MGLFVLLVCKSMRGTFSIILQPVRMAKIMQ